jgi:hypothetical protein
MPENTKRWSGEAHGLFGRMWAENLLARERKQRGAREYKKVRKSDAVLFSPGNSGRTWLRVMLTRVIELHYGLQDAPLIDFNNLHKLNARVPKIAVTHNRWLPYYNKARPQRECRPYYRSKVVMLVRNPLDTCVSQYFQWLHRSKDKNVTLKGWPARDSGLSLLEFMRHRDTGVVRLCQELNMWLRESTKFQRAHLVRYEDLRRSTLEELANIVHFIEIEASPETLAAAIEFGSFENMRQREQAGRCPTTNDQPVKPATREGDAFKARRGKIGGYLKYLDPEQCKYYEDVVTSHLSATFGYSNLPDILPAIQTQREP